VWGESDLIGRFVDVIVAPLVGQTQAVRQSLGNDAEDDGTILKMNAAIGLARFQTGGASNTEN